MKKLETKPAIEQKPDHEKKERVKFILGDLGLKWDDLRGKRVLDIGSGLAQLARVANREGISIISSDPYLWGHEKEVSKEGLKKLTEGVPFVKASADLLPFPSETFDVATSHAAPPLVGVNTEADVGLVIDEVYRVLKNGGEFRFGPGYLPTYVFDKEIFTSEEGDTFTAEQRKVRIADKTLELFKNISPHITRHKIESEIDRNFGRLYYYILHKPYDNK
ncbi:MAG: hypothetical protein A2750_03085 [Candidatus Yanofskybacteria bacterium RIFCSPHIGHO2_01_FULL_45_42]|uniref:Methyltransferase type 11 domain-containing protein n=3 Tax=Candidatus Yanofskyibacteriota TaxID=1752733 RepID=A0A1F8F4V4_9BACT|nr:MAG: hypothetical protein A2750_03085 [Candidatus Yanofskybacteria bacterium RIFCSPHIGHO2_01_FULL_45_42]OGN16441.1 MAG: hypothetical protein A3C81_00535 [Candidatus Yanofskybacteria bacterium RIFCSPHIGHO2_02_FULL_46_19]OGN27370.1 MAG: hypothetical protein A3B17_00195 [Candidatus Yanofskybacteria bacterium RIFCSPLOWO2_01_FULL_45_72]OGN31691.1 MAG: hypothetical protein A3J01_02220 [Candidatus Yanofskybacteria bacterium RIFCSPLOWO2_02_FULL_45_18]